MITLLLVISLLLHIVAFYFIIVLYSKYTTIKDLAATQRQMLEETEQSLTSFLIEIKDENQKLLQILEDDYSPIFNHENGSKKSKVNVQGESGFSDIKRVQAHSTAEELPHYLSDAAEIEDIIEIKNVQQKNNRSFEEEAIILHEKGHTVEQIAKKLNKGKTEIELLLKFRQ